MCLYYVGHRLFSAQDRALGAYVALGVPVAALTTDFQTYGLASGRSACAFPDPMLDILLTDVVRVHRLAPPPAHTADRFTASCTATSSLCAPPPTGPSPLCCALSRAPQQVTPLP